MNMEALSRASADIMSMSGACMLGMLVRGASSSAASNAAPSSYSCSCSSEPYRDASLIRAPQGSEA